MITFDRRCVEEYRYLKRGEIDTIIEMRHGYKKDLKPSSQLQIPSFFNHPFTPFGLVPAPYFVEAMGLVNVPCHDLCRDGEEKDFFITFFLAEVQREVNESVSIATLAHFRLKHEETELGSGIVCFRDGDAPGGNTIAFEDVQAVSLWVEVVGKFIYDLVHIGRENV